MHFLSVFAHPDSEVLISVAEQMEEIMAGYAVLYPYGNLSSDMFPGVPVLYSHVCLGQLYGVSQCSPCSYLYS